MKIVSMMAAAAVVLTTAGAAPVWADPGRGHGKQDQFLKHEQRGALIQHRRHPGHAATCPPGLAKKTPPCVPPGQAKKAGIGYGHRVGQVLRAGDYRVVRDPRRFDLEPRLDWRYYRDDASIYRVDSETRRILAVLSLARALGN